MGNQILVLPISLTAFAVIFATGFILHNRQRPYSTLLLTVHKLIALGTVILAGYSAWQSGFRTGMNLILLAGTAIAALLLIISGGLISGMKEPPAILKWIHLILPWPVLAATGSILFLVVGG